MAAPKPRLVYAVWDRDIDRPITAGVEIPIYNVHEVSCSDHAGHLEVWISGPLMKVDGSRGRTNRSTRLDVTGTYPQWLEQIIGDAETRLRVYR